MVALELVLLCAIGAGAGGAEPIFSSEGDVYVAVILDGDSCRNSTTDLIPYRLQTLASSAVWTTHRLNFLQVLTPLKLGFDVYEACTESDYYKIIFDLYQEEEAGSKYLLGVVTDGNPSEKVSQFCEVLDVRILSSYKYQGNLVRASVKVLSSLGWAGNVTVLAPDDNLLREFYRYSKKEFVCVKDCLVYGNDCPATLNTTNPFLFFGNGDDIKQFVKNQNFEDNPEGEIGLFVPLDGTVPLDLPEGSYVVVPPHSPPSTTYKKPENILPTPLLFDLTKPMLLYAKNAEAFIATHCNDTLYKLNCLRNKYDKNYHPYLITPSTIMEMLKIEPLRPSFVYDVFRVENETSPKKNYLFQPFTKIFTYNIFDGNLTILDQSFETNTSTAVEATEKCLSYFSKRNYRIIAANETDSHVLNFRSESWVFAFLSLSLLGVLFCISVLVFLLLAIFRRDILEGNPILTLSLLLAVMLLFCSVLPFSLEYNKQTQHHLCIARALATTLGYATVFSLVLSRCILLATAAKEIGFMSHIAGPVQAFLCLFIFGVQAALNLQIIGKCYDIFKGYSFLYLMSYNVMLLLLLLCLCPLMYKSQRNYREGKYFTIAVVLTTITWSVWMPCYAFLGDQWKEPVLCSGMVCTAGIFLGAVFIPRTYLMTIAAAKDKITNTLPSMGTATSVMDIYRANTQPIYDCVNVAAINAVTVARAGVGTTGMQQPDLYSCPALPDDEDFDFRCETPPNSDKVTRF
ncbi:hypothetical protein NQ315_011830 [Exocentrus adspersus]|uniref:G-protein coupled receptors family 3 profile domain-containing protein n=1 Tax=Exocentrus adspersus TaxID=1586481 RepID=A0AAV8W0S0_9CUCU|nr:hypothetical protein NQ315_011830 [Exocentrus adspersus]